MQTDVGPQIVSYEDLNFLLWDSSLQPDQEDFLEKSLKFLQTGVYKYFGKRKIKPKKAHCMLKRDHVGTVFLKVRGDFKT